MTKIETLEDLREWVGEKLGRTANIEFGSIGDNTTCKIWVYDYELAEGQFIKIPGEITLYEDYPSKLEKEMEKIKKKMEALA